MLIPFLPRTPAMAALPVSPEVAPRMFMKPPVRASTYSNRLPSSCRATSLKASVGPWNSSRMYRSPTGRTGVTCGWLKVAQLRSISSSRSVRGMSSMNSDRISRARYW